jgi:hypothetical protein
MQRCPRAFLSAPNLEIRINDTFGTDAKMARQLPWAHRRMSFPLWPICYNDASVGFVQKRNADHTNGPSRALARQPMA